MSERKTENPVPPRVPGVNRETGAVTSTPEYSNLGEIDGWKYSEDPFEGGVHAALNFNDECPDAQRKAAVAEFNKKPAGSGI